MSRYFYSELASRPILGSGLTINFERTGIIGSNICGIYASDNPGELGVLDAAVAQKAGVIEISKEEYEQQVAQKKTTQPFQQSSMLKIMPVRVLQTASITEQRGVESVENPEARQLSEMKAGKVEDPKSVIKVDTVASPGFVNESERVAKVEVKPTRMANTKANAKVLTK